MNFIGTIVLFDDHPIVNIIICDGKTCGTGKYLGGGHYVCAHNNLAVLYPHLIKEWDESNSFTPYEVTPGTMKKAVWKCINDPR